MNFTNRRLTILKNALAIMTKAGHFVKGSWASDAEGNNLAGGGGNDENRFNAANSPKACKWCYEGAVMKATGDLGGSVLEASDAIRTCDAAFVGALSAKVRKNHSRLMWVNDEDGKAAVVKGMRAAITRLEKDFAKEQKAAKAC